MLVIKTIVSREGTSLTGTIEFDPEDECFLDDHLVAECGDEAYGVEVTAIECGGKRLPRAKAKDITTLWTRTIDRVVVKISVHDGRKTIPLYLECEGEDEFVVGEKYVVDGKRFTLSHLKLRDGPLMRKEGLEDRRPPYQAYLRVPVIGSFFGTSAARPAGAIKYSLTVKNQKQVTPPVQLPCRLFTSRSLSPVFGNCLCNRVTPVN